MNLQLLIPILTIAGTLLLVMTGLLNFSVFVRQLRAAREQLETARRQLEHVRLGPEMQLVQRAMQETSDHLKLLVDKPYLRPYFYDNKSWAEGDRATLDEVKAMSELLLDNLASAIIHSAAFPQYPLRGVEQNIKFHLRNSPACRDYLLDAFDRFPLAGLALLSLKNETQAQTEDDLRLLIGRTADATEKARRERLLRHLQTTDRPEPLELAKYSYDRFCHLRTERCGPPARVAS